MREPASSCPPVSVMSMFAVAFDFVSFTLATRDVTRACIAATIYVYSFVFVWEARSMRAGPEPVLCGCLP